MNPPLIDEEHRFRSAKPQLHSCSFVRIPLTMELPKWERTRRVAMSGCSRPPRNAGKRDQLDWICFRLGKSTAAAGKRLIFFWSNLLNLQRRCLVSSRRPRMSALALCEGIAKSPCWSGCSRSRLVAASRGRRGAVACRREKLGTSRLLRASPSFRTNSR